MRTDCYIYIKVDRLASKYACQPVNSVCYAAAPNVICDRRNRCGAAAVPVRRAWH